MCVYNYNVICWFYETYLEVLLQKNEENLDVVIMLRQLNKND